MRIVKPARGISKAIKSGNPILFLAGHDRKLRAIPMKAGITGYLHDKDLESIPDDKAVYNFYGTEGLIASTQSVSNINPEFLQIIEAYRTKQMNGGLAQMEDVLGRKIGFKPKEQAESMYLLEQRKKQVEKRMEFIKQIATDQTTMEEKIKEFHMDPPEEQRFREEVQIALDELKDNNKLENTTLGKEYQKITAARQIEVTQNGWAISESPPKNKNDKWTYTLVRKALVTMDDFYHFLPTGSSMNAIWTMVRRAEQANKLESSFNEAQGFKWMIIGTVVMMVFIGAGVMVYLVVKK